VTSFGLKETAELLS